MATLVRWISLRQVFPRRAGTQDPKYPVQNGPRLIEHRPALPSWPLRRVGKKGREYFPLFLGYVHPHLCGEKAQKSRKILKITPVDYEMASRPMQL